MTSTFLVDFNGANDTGEKDATSIDPVVPGETVTSAVLKRPSEVLRTRTEILRDLVENGLYRADADMKWAITGVATQMPAVTEWSMITDTFTTDRTIRVQPLNGPLADVAETQTYTIGTGCEVLITTIRYDWSEPSANETVVVWQVAALGLGEYCTVAVSGLPTPHIITITIDTVQGANWGHVKTALTANEALMLTAGVYRTISGAGADVELVTLPAELPSEEDPGVSQTYNFRSTYTREYHDVQHTVFETFFRTNSLQNGNTLAIKFTDLTARRSNNGNVTAGDLFLTSSATYDIPLAIPLVKRVGNDLYWLDGTVITGPSTTPVYFGEHQTTVTRILGYATTTNLAAHTSASPQTAAAERIGVTVAPLQTNLNTIVDKINDKGSLGADETLTGVWTAPGFTTTALNQGWGHRVNHTDTSIGSTQVNLFQGASTVATIVNVSVVAVLQAVVDFRNAVIGGVPSALGTIKGLELAAWDRSLVNDLTTTSNTASHAARINFYRQRYTGGTSSLLPTADKDLLGAINFNGYTTGDNYGAGMAVYQRLAGGDVTASMQIHADTVTAYTYATLALEGGDKCIWLGKNVVAPPAVAGDIDFQDTYLQLDLTSTAVRLQATTNVKIDMSSSSFLAQTSATCYITVSNSGPTASVRADTAMCQVSPTETYLRVGTIGTEPSLRLTATTTVLRRSADDFLDIRSAEGYWYVKDPGGITGTAVLQFKASDTQGAGRLGLGMLTLEVESSTGKVRLKAANNNGVVSEVILYPTGAGTKVPVGMRYDDKALWYDKGTAGWLCTGGMGAGAYVSADWT
jgi:hypothetical protein